MNRPGSHSTFSRPYEVSLWWEGIMERPMMQSSLG